MKRIITLAFALLCIGLQGAWAQTDVSSESELTAAIKDGANIRLTSDIALGSLLKIGDGAKHVVTIDLNGHKLSRSLSAINSNGHVIEVFGTDDKLTLKNGTISGGWAENGGGICNFGQLELESVTITDCKGTNGGGLHNKENATLTINGGSITGCSTTAGGGAIVNHGTATISNCTMSNNKGGTRGGAIWSNGSELKIEASTFDSNQADLQGGAFYLDKGEVDLAAVNITNNTSEDAGGILVSLGAKVTIMGATSNSTISGNTSSKHGGGGIVNNGDLRLNYNIYITGNRCYTDGGGIWNNGQLSMTGIIGVRDNTTISGQTSNVFLKKGKTINAYWIEHKSIISVKLEGGEEGIFTSNYTKYQDDSPTNYFRADDENQMVILSDNEAKLVKRQDAVFYVERSWDAASRSVVSTIKSINDYTELTGSGGEVTLGNGKWYVVKGSNVTRSKLKINSGTSHLILCDGAKLSSVVSFYDSTSGALYVYGQTNDTGQLVADASGTSECSGIGGPDEDNSGGKLVIHGGKITAKGGEYAAGIGGGNDADGGELIVYGGDVAASGGTDAAGIGGGEDGSGGKVTIYGGTVFADGTGWGAGIGGGEDNKGATVKIYGGSVTAWAGSDAGDKNGCAIGSEDDDKGSLEFGPNMAVRAGQSPSGISRFTKDERTSACWYRPYCEITPCDHDGATYTVSGTTANDTHTLVCSYCQGANAEKHVFSDDKCAICGVSKKIWTASIYLPELVDGKSVNGHYAASITVNLIDRAQFTLPAPPADRIPEGVAFAGWRVGSPSELGITSYAVGNNENVLKAGEKYTMTSDVSFTARYITNVVDLYDGEYNDNTIYKNNNKMARPATLWGRTLYKDGSWNTLCLPFDLPIAGSTLDGDGVDVRTLVSSSYANGLLTLNFTEKGEVTTIEAGKPYLIKWDSGEDLLNPEFDEVIIKYNLTYVKTEHVTFMGIYDPKIIDDGSASQRKGLYVGPNNMLYYASVPDGEDFTLNSFRAYFELAVGYWADADGFHDRTNGARQIVLNFGDDATAIRTVEAEEHRADDAWYDLNGRRLTGKPVQKGVYVKNGKKVVIK